jgi:hypothetical protein
MLGEVLEPVRRRDLLAALLTERTDPIGGPQYRGGRLEVIP